MGVYIPPGSDGGEGDSSSSGNGNGGGGTIITIPNPSSFIPRNPSIGLKLWGPLVPASDNSPALYILTGLQIFLGVLGFHKARQLRSSNLMRMGVPNIWQRKINKWACALGGAYLVFQSGLEITRLSLPYDPWFEEARYYRKLAIKNGDSPSWWFGATGYYIPMSFNEWNQKVEKWISNQANAIEGEDQSKGDGYSFRLQRLGRAPSPVLTKLAQKGKYAEIHNSLHDNNRSRISQLLLQDLKDVNELNKGPRLDSILEGNSSVKYNENYLKPHIQLGNHEMDTDEAFEMVWLNFDPWDELKSETDYDIRLIPRWRWQDEEEDTASA